MRRAIQLARLGEGFTSPNPMVGAVVVAPDGRIIGEGFHRRWGGPHAEVNALASVQNRHIPLLGQSTLYVTLEPCSHYGKTPPCSRLIIERGLKRVVVGAGDPFPKVAGRGITMMRDAGIEVIEGVLEDECTALNRRFMTAHTSGRPFIQLKWAMTAGGDMAAIDTEGHCSPISVSTPLTSVMMHRERARTDAVLVGTRTVLADNPSLTCRLWPGSDPRPVTFAGTALPGDARIMQREPILLDPARPLGESVRELYAAHSVTSLMVEGGAETLTRFLEAGLWDEIRVETAAPSRRDLPETGLPAPHIPDGAHLCGTTVCDGALISTWRR